MKNILFFLLITVGILRQGFCSHVQGILMDTAKTFSIDNVINRSFQPHTSSTFDFGFTDQNYWLSIPPDDNGTILQLQSPELDTVIAYFLHESKIISHSLGGFRIPLKQREYDDRLPTFNIPKGTTRIILKINSSVKINFSVHFFTEKEYRKSSITDILLFCIFHSLILIVFLYNLILFVKLKEPIYGFYSLYLIFLFLSGLAITGFHFFFTESLGTLFLSNIMVSGMLMGFCLFTTQALRLKEHYHKLNYLFLCIALLGLVLFTVSLFIPSSTTITKLLHIIPAISMILAFVSALLVFIRKRFKYAVLYLIGWSAFFVGALFLQFQAWGLISNNAFTSNLHFFGAGIQAIFFSFSIANQMKDYKVKIESTKERLDAYKTEIEKLRDQIINPQEKGLKITLLKKDKINNYLLNPLSERELEILSLLALGKTNKTVAEELFLSVNTVKTHIRNIYEKLDVKNRTEATNKAQQLDLI